MAFELRCACGTVLRERSGERLLDAVERHALDVHAQSTWRAGPSRVDLGTRLVELERRLGRLEQRGAGT